MFSSISTARVKDRYTNHSDSGDEQVQLVQTPKDDKAPTQAVKQQSVEDQQLVLLDSILEQRKLKSRKKQVKGTVKSPIKIVSAVINAFQARLPKRPTEVKQKKPDNNIPLRLHVGSSEKEVTSSSDLFSSESQILTTNKSSEQSSAMLVGNKRRLLPCVSSSKSLARKHIIECSEDSFE